MNYWDLLASDAVQVFIEEALSRKWDALQVSTALHKAGYSNEERATIMDYWTTKRSSRSSVKNFSKKQAGRESFCCATSSHWSRAPRKTSAGGKREFGLTKVP